MARHKKQSAAAAPDEQTVASKLRRPAIKWDHRKDKYLLLAVFAQQNTPAPDYKQLADALGSETYSPDAVKRRLLTLKEMAAAVIEDRHDRHEETAAEQSATEDDDIILVKETAVQAPKTTINGPPTPSSSQRQAQPRVQQVAPKANTRPPPSQPTNQKNDQNSQNTAPFNRQINNQMNHPHSRTRRSRRNRKTANQPSQVLRIVGQSSVLRA
ncbi:hypothetical protein ASPCAL07240 [Aspergillus calidoustus]|uniref:Uncharacterized protein n=1 Tax=Aspergillus calidoustus TaxID=454130 RepID=A0A0U5G3G2_ASPCI|nr:hypothetical protein ASPCAL07240 [Aspergillus calidoustus]